MFKTLKSKWRALAVIVLLALNLAAVYLLNQSIENRKLLAHAGPELQASLHEQEVFGNMFSAAVFTVDIVAILIVLYILLKLLTKKFKSPTTKS